MTVKEARKMARAFDENKNPSEEEIFLYTEAMNYLIEEEKNPQDMMCLGGYYYEIKRFDLALKYYEMAAAMDYDCAYECLGYIWYYGRTGERDYKKAFENFSKVAATGNIVAKYKIADMYKNGYYVEQNQEKYEEIIEELYQDSRRWSRNIPEVDYSELPFPEIYTRLARIRKEHGNIEDAINLYLEAKPILARRISFNAFFGNLNIMKWLIDDLYELMDFDEDFFDFFDLYYLLKTPHTIGFAYDGMNYIVESVMEGGECVVNFDGKWFHNRDEFFQKAMIGEYKITAISEELFGLEVII